MAAEVALHICHHGFTPFDPQRPKALIQQLQFPSKPLAFCLATDHEVSAAAAADNVREAEEVEGCGAAQPVLVTVPLCAAAKAQYRRLVGFHLQLKGRQSFHQLGQKTPCILLILEARDEIISKAHQVCPAPA